jgi:hypothetical protein
MEERMMEETELKANGKETIIKERTVRPQKKQQLFGPGGNKGSIAGRDQSFSCIVVACCVPYRGYNACNIAASGSTKIARVDKGPSFFGLLGANLEN